MRGECLLQAAIAAAAGVSTCLSGLCTEQASSWETAAHNNVLHQCRCKDVSPVPAFVKCTIRTSWTAVAEHTWPAASQASVLRQCQSIADRDHLGYCSRV